MKQPVCPNCQTEMTVKKLYCPNCDISVEGSFNAHRLSALDEETLSFMEIFIMARGNIKEIEKVLKISYPTVKSKIDKMVDNLFMLKENEAKREESAEVEKKRKIEEEERIRLITSKR